MTYQVHRDRGKLSFQTSQPIDVDTGPPTPGREASYAVVDKRVDGRLAALPCTTHNLSLYQYLQGF